MIIVTFAHLNEDVMDKSDFIGIIPARYASTRFPGKPLVEIGGKSMIQRVYEQVSKVLSAWRPMISVSSMLSLLLGARS